MKIKNIIYGLRDPRNDVYCYIGKSSVGVSRPLTHLIKSHSENIRAWVSELMEKGLNPLIDIIEEVTTIDELPLREKYWIDYYFNLNPFLLNIYSIPKEIIEIRSNKTDQDLDKLLYIIDIIPEILKRERKLRGLTQDECSKLSGISRSTISLIERGLNINLNSIKIYLKSIITKKRTVNKHRKTNRTYCTKHK